MKDNIFPRTFDKQIVYLKNVINTPDIEVGDYTMYNDFVHDPIDFEKNNSLTGLNYLNDLYQAILNQQPLSLKYRSFKARSAATFVFYPYLLKEYRNRWFVFGSKKNTRMLYNLALDRILELAPAKDEPYYGNSNFDPSTFFDDIVCN